MKVPKTPPVLQLSDHEAIVLTVLDTPKHVTGIASVTGIPRTSIGYILQSLMRRGIVREVMVGKRTQYEIVSEAERSNAILGVQTFFGVEGIRAESAGGPGLHVRRGVAEIIQLQRELLTAQPKHTRVKAIQPNSSFLACFSVATVDDIVRLNAAISESRVILDAIIEHDAYDVYREYWKMDPEGYERLNATYLNRTSDYVVVDGKQMPFATELWLYSDVVVIINWKEKIAVLIANQETRGLLEVLYDTLKATGRKVDHAEQMVK